MDYSQLSDAELDRLAAERMGLKWKDATAYALAGVEMSHDSYRTWAPSRVIVQAFEFAEHCGLFDNYYLTRNCGKWVIARTDNDVILASAPTPARAITLACFAIGNEKGGR